MRALKEGKFIVVNHVSETEETTSSYELAESLLFNLSKNQFTWSGSPQNFFHASQAWFLITRHFVEDQQWNMHSVENCKRDFNLYSKIKTLLVKGKVVHVQSTRKSLRQICEEPIQLGIDESAAITSNQVVHESRHPWTRSR